LDGRPPLHALSLRFDVGAADEGEIQTGVARLLGMPQIIHDVSDILGKKSIVRASLDLSQISPIPIFGLWQSMYTGLLESASLRGLRKLLMGTGGDEIFYVDARYAADCLLSFELAGLWRFFRSFARASSSSSLRIARNIFWTYSTKLILVQMFRSALEASLPRLAESLRRRHLALEGWLVPSDPLLREKLMHRRLYPPKVEKQSMEGYYARAIRSLPQSPILMAQHEQSHCWAGEAGFTMFYPYFDRDLVELSLRLPPEYLVSGSQAKAPLRRLVAERLHGLTLPPRKVAFTQPYDSILRGQGLPVWRELHELTRLVELDLVAPQHLTPIIEDYFAGKNNQRQITWSILSAEYWLRAHMK
jgi:asparagine synthetase B (glutamine-hydrolysing)